MILLRAIAPYLIFAGIIAGIIFGVHQYTASSTAERLNLIHQAQIARIKADGLKQVADLTEKARAQERGHAEAMTELDTRKTKEIENERTEAERAVADLRAGVMRVRDEFRCDAAHGGAPKAGAAPRMGDAAKASGLQGAHVEFLLREAARADEVTVQLQACQAIVKQDRGE